MFYDGKIYASLITWPFSMFLPAAVALLSVLRVSSGFCVFNLSSNRAHTHTDLRERKTRLSETKDFGTNV